MENESEPIFIARRLKEAKELEEIFSNAGIEYDVEPDHYSGGVIFKTTRVGAFFYVSAEMREKAIEVMLANGYIPAR